MSWWNKVFFSKRNEKKNCISQTTENIFKNLFKSQQVNKPSSLTGRQREGVRKCLPLRPVQPEGQCESFKGNAQPPSTDPRMMGEGPDHCWCQHGLCWYVGGIDVLAPERKNQADGYQPQLFSSHFSGVYILLVPSSASPLWWGSNGQMIYLKLPSCLCCAGEWRLSMNIAFPRTNASTQECYLTSQGLNGKIRLRFAFPFPENVCLAPRNFLFSCTPTHVNELVHKAIYCSTVWKSKGVEMI